MRILTLGAPRARAFIEPLLYALRGQHLSPFYRRVRGSESGSELPNIGHLEALVAGQRFHVGDK